MNAPARPAPRAGARDRDLVVSVRDVERHFPIREGMLQRVTGHVRAVDGVSFDVRRGETVGLVGESGCGKTTLGRCVGGLDEPTAGAVYFGLDAAGAGRLDALCAVPEAERGAAEREEMRALGAAHRIDLIGGAARARFRRNCQMVFQDSFASLNPRQLVADIVGRPLRVHREASGAALTGRVVELLEQVGLGRQHLYRYPHQFSGGQRQRISIARAIALDPELIILDEPTSALDVSVQAQILNLLSDLQAERGLAYLFVTHDLSVVRHMADRIVTMYLGKVVEAGPTGAIFGNAQHPYTRALMAAKPDLAQDGAAPMRALEGVVPDPARPPEGCRFHTRCAVATPRCGWEVDDVVRFLEAREDLFADLVDVERESPFAASLVFGEPASAERLAAAVRPGRVPAAMLEALERLEASGRRVVLRFAVAPRIALRDCGEGHVAACVLAQGAPAAP